jgi:uncharacterized protein (TIGR01777 family)
MIAVAGASGFVGRAVCDALTMRGLRVATIGRRAEADIRWPAPGGTFTAEDFVILRQCRAVVNVVGETIGARWTPARRRAIRESREGLTRALCSALAAREQRPATLISASAVGIYGDRGDTWLDESSSLGDDFLASVAREWESATEPARAAGMRVVRMRLGVIFGANGGMIGKLRLPFSLGLGAKLGSGEQWLSWIAISDVVSFVLRAIDDDAFSGAINVTAPDPITNADFTKLMGRILGKPTILPAPAFGLRLAFGQMANGVLLASQRVRPAGLLERNFAFEHPTAEGALRAALEMRAA